MGDVDGSPVGMMVYEVGDVDLHKAIHPDTDGPALVIGNELPDSTVAAST
ncbi:MAG TPA: hypothetical protein VMC78_01735 [Mycobacterium sp.]|nr:hypothetical protein [Mycobacterium sp.]